MKFDPARIQGMVDAQAEEREATRIQESIEVRFDKSLEGLFRAFPFLQETNADFSAVASELEEFSPEDAAVARDAVKVKLIEAKQSFEELLELTVPRRSADQGSHLEGRQFRNFGDLAGALSAHPDAAEQLDKIHAASDFIELSTAEVRRETSGIRSEISLNSGGGRPWG